MTKQSLSCEYCRKKKIGCTVQKPCQNCLNMGIKCSPVTKDNRTKKFSHSYVRSLQSQVESLRAQLSKQASGKDTVPIRNGTILPGVLENERFLINKRETSFAIPSSIISLSQQGKSSQTTTDFETFHKPVIIDHLSNFFRWQYQDNVFIHRESFLTDFFKEKTDLKTTLSYCNEELIFAICALGSQVLRNHSEFTYKGNVFKSPDSFYSFSRTKLLSNIGHESFNDIPSVQALLCLAHFDLGRGHNLAAWSLSGLAFRIGQHTGFEHKPSMGQLSDYDVQVRSRVYWGCYLADHKMSLILGRQCMLHDSKATIEESEDLPILIGIEQFMYMDPMDEKNPNFKIAVHLKYLVELYKIAGEYQGSLFRQRGNGNSVGVSQDIILQLGNFNLDIMNWKLALDDLSWTKVELKTKGYNPNVMNMRFQYHLIMLCFNRPFLSEELNSSNQNSSFICAEVIEELYNALQCFQTHYTFHFASLTMVFNTILAISVLKLLPPGISLVLRRSSLFKYFFHVLKECSETWKVARNFCDSINSALGNPPQILSSDQIGHVFPDFDEFIDEDLNFLLPGEFGF